MLKRNYLLLLPLLMLFACGGKQHYASFNDYPVYDGTDLELTYSSQASAFRLWAPTADQVKLLLYDNGSEGAAYQVIDMDESEQGTWVKKIKEDLIGKFYTFQIRIGEKWYAETPGVWVKATGVNGKRAAIIDMDDTNPDGWNNDSKPELKNFTDIVLYELHMRDFSMSQNSGIKNKGKYLAFTENGTKNSAGEATGIDHLKELGVTHVHLLPSYDFASIDETTLEKNVYNWGYDPLNYNVPEGSYSTNPHDPVTRIKEFKQMVQALHKAGIRVVMDVVYNHTFTADESHLNLTVPGYFYRMKADSTWSDASGCGNETASERAMMRKFIVESVTYWAKEYHIDGFRFDLMGIHDIETMNAVRDALNKVDQSIFIYGEGWTAGASPLAEDKRAVKKNAKQLNGIAVFSDDIRDALKGSWSDEKTPGFAAGKDSLEESVKFGIVGGVQHSQIDYTKLIYSKEPYVAEPSQTINYVSCHDDLCLVDKLKISNDPKASEADLIRSNKLAQTVVFTSQGVPFIYAGEELYRNKKGVHNTYQSPDSINQIDWNFKTIYKDVFTYYQGLIALRKAHPAFRISKAQMIQDHLQFIDSVPANVIAYKLTDHVNGDSWKEIMMLLNGNKKAMSVPMPEGKWNLVCHDGVVNLNGIKEVNSKEFRIEPLSASILYLAE